MNRDQIKGTGKEIAGKVQKNLGRATGSGKNELKGAAKEATGKVQKAFGDARKKTS